ncbi:uncharacterized protein C1orf167 homolog isoform X2 [Python bivittatus]|uniref:Uncharacterized protein C1orf167 homolog isoform X2 n=1 Tax=Python bivittatus TaxID=176946 RepID=A0A9F5IGZ5_PYTBI|nr:uncharacterized protein C1orf167 homolog isoform X2 [Python bivittatus]
MEFPQRIQTAARKENIPPALSCYVTPREQRHIQKNVSVNLFPAAGSRIRAFWPQTGSDVRGSNPTGENAQSRLRAAPARREACGRFQTNLLCPSGSRWGPAKDALPQQQSNLGSKLQRRRWEGGTLQAGLKRTPRTGFPDRRRDVPRATSRMENRDQDLLKRRHGLFSVSKRSYEDLKASRESSSPTQSSVVPRLDSPMKSCPLPMTFSGISDSSPPGPALTLDCLNSSTSVDGRSSPAGSQTLVGSSQSSADLQRSFQGLKKEATSTEAGGSFPCESPSSSRLHWLPREPQISTLAVRKVLEASVKGSCWGQRRNKWRTTLRSTLLACQGGYSSSSISCFKSSFGRQPATSKKATLGELRAQGYLRTLDPEELPSGAFYGSEMYLKDLPLDVFSFKGLESSLETLCAEPSLNKGLSMEEEEEEPPTIHPSGDPEVPLFHPFARQKVNPFGEAIRKGPRKCFQPANSTDQPDMNLTGRRENVSLAGQRNQSQVPSAGRASDGVDPAACQAGDDGTALMEENLEDDVKSVERRDGSHPLLAKCFVAWHSHIFGKRDAAQALHEHHLLHKGVGALQWAVQLRSVQREAAQKHHTLGVLAGSFWRWQDAAAKQRGRPGSEESGALTGGKAGLLGRKCAKKPPALHQPSPGCLQFCRAERLRWAQLRGREEGRELSQEKEEVQDWQRRLAAAGRPWHLQEETLAEEGAPLPAVCVLLEKKTLGEAFRRWRSHGPENQQIRLLASRIQGRLIGRCLNGWKRVVQRQRQSEVGLARRRAKSLRACFQQWSLMVQAREKAKGTLAALLAGKRRSSCGESPNNVSDLSPLLPFPGRLAEEARPSCSSPNAPGAPRGPAGARWPQRNGEATLEYLFHLRALQGAFRTWKARCWEARRAGAFCRGLALRQLREALQRWRWRGLNPPGLAEGSLLASPGSRESSFSSGLASASSSREKEIQLVEPSLISLSSLVTVEDPSVLLPPGPRCPRCDSNHENPTHVADQFPAQGSPLRLNWRAASKCGRLWRHRVRLHRFQEARDARQLAKAWQLWKGACRTKRVVQALSWQRRAQWGWKIWRRRRLQLQVARRFQEAEEEQLLKTAFGKWCRLAAASCAQIE